MKDTLKSVAKKVFSYAKDAERILDSLRDNKIDITSSELVIPFYGYLCVLESMFQPEIAESDAFYEDATRMEKFDDFWNKYHAYLKGDEQ